MNSTKYDVVIVGAGPTGMALAILLARMNLSVMILESGSADGQKIGENLMPDTGRVLARLGLWDAFSELPKRPFNGIHSAWGSSDLIFQSFIFQQSSQGWQVDRAGFDAMLRNNALMLGCDIYMQSELVSISEAAHRWRFYFRQGDRYHSIASRFLVDAAGRRSPISEMLGHRRVPSDQLVGCATVLKDVAWPQYLNGSMIIESAENGWWYASPQPQGGLIAVYLSDDDLLRESLQHKGLNDLWQSEIQRSKYLSEIAPELLGPNTIRMFPAFSHCLLQLNDPRPWLPVGDAFISRDPLSGRGLLYGLQAALDAAPVIATYLAGDFSARGEYLRTIEEQFSEYIDQQCDYYSMEQRWRDNPFWRRRHFTTVMQAF